MKIYFYIEAILLIFIIGILVQIKISKNEKNKKEVNELLIK